MHYWLQQLQQKRWEYSNMRGSGQRDSWSSPTLAYPHTGLVGKDNGRQVRTHSHIQWICYQSVISSYPGNNWKFTQALQITRVSRILLPSFCRKVFECFERVKVQIDIIRLVFCFKQKALRAVKQRRWYRNLTSKQIQSRQSSNGLWQKLYVYLFSNFF